MNTTLRLVLSLVGSLKDDESSDSPQTRFRSILKSELNDLGQVRDFIEECLRESGDQYDKALQDLVNLVGKFLGFEVEFGRYRGVQGKIGYDGIWKSSTGISIVAEVKTTDVYSVTTDTLLGYMNKLVSSHIITDASKMIGLYIIGHSSSDSRQLQNTIIAEGHTDELRVISVDSLLALAEMKEDYKIKHEDILSIISPKGCLVDSIINLIKRIASEPSVEEPTISIVEEVPETKGSITYWLAPVANDEEQPAEKTIMQLVFNQKCYAFADRTPGRRRVKPGDWICFYASTKGVVAHAKIETSPSKTEEKPENIDTENYPWVFKLSNPKIYLENPINIDYELRSKLDAFKNKDLSKTWAWFVTATREITGGDFNRLTRN